MVPAQFVFDRKLSVVDRFEQLKLDLRTGDLVGLAFLLVPLDMVVGEVDVQFSDALAARLVSCAV